VREEVGEKIQRLLLVGGRLRIALQLAALRRGGVHDFLPPEKDDIFKILTQADPKSIADAASMQSCKLESYAQTPSYAP